MVLIILWYLGGWGHPIVLMHNGPLTRRLICISSSPWPPLRSLPPEWVVPRSLARWLADTIEQGLQHTQTQYVLIRGWRMEPLSSASILTVVRSSSLTLPRATASCKIRIRTAEWFTSRESPERCATAALTRRTRRNKRQMKVLRFGGGLS